MGEKQEPLEPTSCTGALSYITAHYHISPYLNVLHIGTEVPRSINTQSYRINKLKLHLIDTMLTNQIHTTLFSLN